MRLGVAALMGAFLLILSADSGWAYMLAFTLVWVIVVLALGAAFVGGKRGRARAIARIRGTRRSGPAQLAVSTASLLYVTLLLLTANGRRWSSEMLDELQWALLIALLVTSIWALYDEGVQDRDLDRDQGTPSEPLG